MPSADRTAKRRLSRGQALSRCYRPLLKDQKPQNLFRPISRTIFSTAMIMRFPRPQSTLEPKLGASRLLVPGQLLRAPIPNYIKLHTESGELSWHTPNRTWIPEDRFYDHLVLKFSKD